MWHSISRFFMAVWFVGMVGLAVWNGRGAVAQGGGNTLYFPITQNDYDWAVRDYIGLVTTANGYFTVRGDGSGWQALGDAEAYYGVWSPDGTHFAYSAEGGVWVVPLDTRQPHFVASGEARFPIWSPDSRYFVYPTPAAVHVFDVQTFDLHVFPIEGEANSFYWSPNGAHLAWTGYSANRDTELWIWTGGNDTPRLVARNVYDYPYGPFWSPDGSTLIYNNQVTNSQARVYTIRAEGGSPTVLLEDAAMHGWVEGGARILLRHSGNLYLALPDGTMQTLFFADVGNNSLHALIAPDGDRVLFNSSNGRQYVQATTSTTASLVEFGDCYNVNQWQTGGNLVSCAAVQGNYAGYLGLKVGDGTASPITPLIERPLHIYPQFLTGPTPYMATSRFTTRPSDYGGYPVLDVYEGSYLFNLRSGSFKRIHYPEDRIWRVLEWRYLP